MLNKNISEEEKKRIIETALDFDDRNIEDFYHMDLIQESINKEFKRKRIISEILGRIINRKHY